jgi:hypothetical protein
VGIVHPHPCYRFTIDTWRIYQNAGKTFIAAVRGTLISGLVTVHIAVIFFIQFELGVLLPGNFDPHGVRYTGKLSFAIMNKNYRPKNFHN